MTNNVNNVSTNSVWQAIFDKMLGQKTEQKPIIAEETPTIETDSQDEDVKFVSSNNETQNINGKREITPYYDENGKLIKEVISTGGTNFNEVIYYNDDGTTKREVINRTTGNIESSVLLDKDGKEIKDPGEPAKVKEGEKG